MNSIGSRATRSSAVGVAIAFLTLVLPLSAFAASPAREQCEKQFSPRSGQAGKDVIWVPTLDELASAMLKAAKVTRDDYVIDLGSGDGKIPIMAAKQFGARAKGVEYNPLMVQLARCYVRAEGMNDKVEIVRGDIFETDFSQATVLTLYLLSDLNIKLRPTILALKPGTRVVSNTFKMGDWSPDEFIESEIGNTRAYMWIVPAQIGGMWKFTNEGGNDSFRLSIVQHHQELKITSPDLVRGLREAKLRGNAIELTFTDRQPLRLAGDVKDETITVTGNQNGRTVIYTGIRVQ